MRIDNDTAESLCATGLRVARAYGLSAQDAEDVVQTTFVRLCEKDRRFDSFEHLKAWVIRVTINGCNDVHRQRAKHPHATMDECRHLAKPPTDEAAGIDLKLAVGRLSPEDRLVLHLHCYEGYPYASVASCLGMTTGAARARMHRIRKTLRKGLVS